MKPSKDSRQSASHFTVLYVAALSAIAILSILGQVLIQVTLKRQTSDSRMINIAGRQRMLSQRLSKAAFVIQTTSDTKVREEGLRELQEVTDLWRHSHNGLQHGDRELDLPGVNSPEVIRMFTEIEPHFRFMLLGAERLPELFPLEEGELLDNSEVSISVQMILNSEAFFLEGMDRIVFQYDREAKARIDGLKRIELMLLGLTLTVLALEGLFVFRPAIRRIRRTVSQLILAKEAFQKSEERYRLLFDHSPDPVVVHDKGKILSVNKACVRALGAKSSEEMVGKMVMEFVHPDYQEVDEERIRRTFEEEESTLFKEKFIRFDGREIEVEISRTPVTYDGKAVIQSAFRDVTEFNKIQKKLAQSKRLAAVGQMAGGVAHEINNPLGNVLGYVELIKDTIDHRTESYADLNGIKDNVFKARKIVSNLLAFARETSFQLESMDLNKIIKATIDQFNVNERPENVAIEFSLDDSLPIVKVDPELLRQIVIILTDNAILSMPDGGTFTVSTGQDADKGNVFIKFTDTGIGIKTENVEKVFDPFFTTREVGEGAGLGLSIAYGIIEAHGGSIQVESEQGKGSIFIVKLPLELPPGMRG